MNKLLFGNVTSAFIVVLASGLLFLMQGCQEKVEQQVITGIASITKGSVDLAIPPSTPLDEVWRYGLGFPFQVASDMAALFVNIRKEGAGSIDFEIGSDVILFDDLENISADNAIDISRYERGIHKDFGETVTRKGPVIGGFVPKGAKLPDGSGHPHAGSGFGLAVSIIHSVDELGHYDYRDRKKNEFELFQFAYDGNGFQVLSKQIIERKDLLVDSDWTLLGNFITNAIPDGPDLLYPMMAKKKTDNNVVSGVTRWQKGPNGWHPVSFTSVTEKMKSWSEPSLIRDVDGSLLFSARSYYNPPNISVGFDIAIWRSMDNGQNFKQVIYRKECRSRSPISIDQAADGTPFIVANFPPLMRRRDILCYWPLNEDRTDLGELRIARDALGQFGPAPSGSWWRIDHPTSTIVRLADGKWHSVLVYRIADNGEIEGDADPASQTGCYVEEVFSKGTPIPIWNF